MKSFGTRILGKMMKLVEAYGHGKKGDQRIRFERDGKVVNGNNSERTGKLSSLCAENGNEWDLMHFSVYDSNLKEMCFLAPLTQ